MEYDVIIIGSGPGGYVAAIRCAQLGMKTALIEKYPTLGGTCLNVGCIPSKTLLDSTELYHQSVHSFAQHGIEIKGSKPQLEQMIKRKDKVIKTNANGISYLMKKHKINWLTGHASFQDNHTLLITGSDKKKETSLRGKKIIIATGSKPTALPFAPFDKNRIISSTEALSLTRIPKHLIIIGGGAIGMELGSVYARLHVKVTIIELFDNLIPTMDKELGQELQKVAKKMKMEIFLQHKVTSVQNKGKNVIVKATSLKTEKSTEWIGDHCLVCVGRTPYTEALGLKNVHIDLNKGFIPVNKHFQTSTENIFAIGDVIGGPMLAHKAEEEAVYVAEFMAGQHPHIHYSLIPSVVYTWPEIASVGHTEDYLKTKGHAYKVGKFPYRALGRAHASLDTDGWVKVLADQHTDEILGVHMIGARAADMIASGVTAMQFRASAEDISRISHAHPSYMEAFKEACLDATEKRALHM